MLDDHIGKIKLLYKEGSYSEVIKLINELESKLLSPNLLVIKGRCLQIQNEVNKNNLPDSEKSFLQALEIDNEYIPALLELAWFYLNVNDDAKKAEPFFIRAIDLSKENLYESIEGIYKSREEIKSKKEALIYIEETKSSIIKDLPDFKNNIL